MGFVKKVFSSMMRRPAKNWNVENRAQSLLDQHEKGKKPSVAPRHPTSAEKIDEFSHEHPEYLKLQKEKNEALHSMLEGMVVNPDKTAVPRSTSRPLPEYRGIVTDQEYGYVEPENIPPGKSSLRKALGFITDHQSDPKTNSVQHIASEYCLDPIVVGDVLKHFQTLQMQFPKGSAGAELLGQGRDTQDADGKTEDVTYVGSGKSGEKSDDGTPKSSS